MTTKSSGFTLIELLVVVAIIGIIAAIGVVSYQGYVASAKKKSAQNVLMQASLGQTEYFSDNNTYYRADSCTRGNAATKAIESTSTNMETNLLGKQDNFNDELGYFGCAGSDPGGSNYMLFAVEANSQNPCIISMTSNNTFVLKRKDDSDC